MLNQQDIMSNKKVKQAEIKRGVLGIGSGSTYPIIICKNGVIKISKE